MWIINNSLDVLHTLEEKQLSLTGMSTWDFSTLYTSLKHPKLDQQLHELLERVFNTREERASSPQTIFTLSGRMIMIGSLIEATLTSPVGNFAWLLTFVSTTSTSASFSGKVNIGIPVGTNSAPLLADLFLHTFEYDFMLNTLKRDMTKAIQFSNTFRYIDDLLSVNNEQFENYISTIYPSELELKNTSTSTPEVCYHDARINSPFYVSIYDKREDFALRIVIFPHMDSNIPSKPAYGVCMSQLVRNARICTSRHRWSKRNKSLYGKRNLDEINELKAIKVINKV